MSQSIPGTLQVSNDCIADLAGYAALECYGIVGMAVTDAQNGITTILPVNRLRKGIEVTSEDGVVIVDLHVVVEQGVNMSSVSQNLCDTVKFLLKRIAQIEDSEIRIHIEGMRLAKQ